MINASRKDAQPLLHLDNHHSDDCGPPPEIDAAGKYVSCYENSYGEQWVFIGDHATKTAELRGGDISWKEVIKVSADRPSPGRFSIDMRERLWLVACVAGFWYLSAEEAINRYDAEAVRRGEALLKVMKQHDTDEAFEFEDEEDTEQSRAIEAEIQAEADRLYEASLAKA